MTTQYSGVGMIEVAMAAAMGLVEGAASPQLAVHHAAEINPACRRVLLRHRPPTRALHIGGDICRRLPPQVQEALESDRQCAWAEWLKLQEQMLARGESKWALTAAKAWPVPSTPGCPNPIRFRFRVCVTRMIV